MFDRMFSGSKSKKDDGTRSQADRTMKKYAPKKWAAELKRRKEAGGAEDDAPKMKRTVIKSLTRAQRIYRTLIQQTILTKL